MAKVNVVDQKNMEVGSMDLAPEVFEVEIKPEVLHLVVRQHMAARRQGTHATKNRALKHGGGRKPWRQKGTGRARAGTIRSPLWKGGATTFGPQPRDYTFKVNKKVRQLALKMALSSRLSDANLRIVDKIDMSEIKTKEFAKVVGALELRKALIVAKDADSKLILSARNIPGVKIIDAEKLNVYDILRYPQLIMLQAAAEDVQKRLK
ncbi:MAG: 50S ribosomal protein L4 [Proteobacteria bacterium]|nr:50S ribosomal protein L4 [Pseudomonadota bacterium]